MKIKLNGPEYRVGHHMPMGRMPHISKSNGLLRLYDQLLHQSPLIAMSAARLGIITVVPWSITRCLLLNSLNVRVTVSRVDPTHSAICSCVNGILIFAGCEVCFSSDDQCKNNRAIFSCALVDKATVRNCSQALAYWRIQLPDHCLVSLRKAANERNKVLTADK